MLSVNNIYERKEVLGYLQKRNLLRQYKKAKTLLLSGYFFQARFKARNPKSSGIWYFRINKQYRALCVFKGNDLIVFKIDDHS